MSALCFPDYASRGSREAKLFLLALCCSWNSSSSAFARTSAKNSASSFGSRWLLKKPLATWADGHSIPRHHFINSTDPRRSAALDTTMDIENMQCVYFTCSYTPWVSITIMGKPIIPEGWYSNVIEAGAILETTWSRKANQYHWFINRFCSWCIFIEPKMINKGLHS